MNSIKFYALRDGINPRKAQRYRAKLKIGKHIEAGATGIWIVTEEEWKLILTAMDGGYDGTNKRKTGT